MGSRYYRGKSKSQKSIDPADKMIQQKECDKSLSSHTDDTFEDSTGDVVDGGSMSSQQSKTRTDATVESDIQSYIDQELKNLHEDVVNEGVPERFQLLLDMLDGKKE